MKHTIQLILGDPGSDGHGIHDRAVFKCTHDAIEIRKLYAATVNLYGFDITEECAEYEESSLSDDFIEAARVAFGQDAEVLQVIDCAVDDEMIDDCDFALIYMKMAQLANTKMQFTPAEPVDEIHIGGYGLYMAG